MDLDGYISSHMHSKSCREKCFSSIRGKVNWFFDQVDTSQQQSSENRSIVDK